MKKLIAFILAFSMLCACFLFGTAAENYEGIYPELLITEIGVDQYGDASNAANKNEKYRDLYADRDPFEFIEIVNNSDKPINVYDYMLAYQGAKSTNGEYFEKSIQEYTPFYPGADWTDGPYTSYDSYWTNAEDKRPVNPEHKDGVIAPGEVFVAWIYNLDSHALRADFDEFRSFWSVDPSVKIFILDGFDTKNKMNFSLKNQTTGTYAIIHSSERFSKRRSSDETFVPEMDNTHHNYAGKTYEELDEVISWAVVDYTTSPLNAIASQTEKSNFTVSYMPRSGNDKAENGYNSSSFITNKRAHISKVNSYAESTVGKLDADQSAAIAKTKTSIVKAPASAPVVLDEVKDRPSLIITEIAVDTYLKVDQNINTEFGTNYNLDAFEAIEVYNNSAAAVNIYDYMIGYQGSSAKNVSTYFERLVQEYTPILPGADWIDAPYTSYDSFWTGTSVARPVNPAYEAGVIQPGEVAVIWMYSKDAHTIHATMDQFRAFWKIPENVKTFILDANSSRDKNFNLKNEDTGTYVILQPCDKYPVRRGDDDTFNTEGGKRLSVYYDLHAGRSYDTETEIVSWAVVCFNVYEPLYSFRGKAGGTASRLNYSLVYAPYNGEHVYGNGFLTISIESQKRMHLQEAVNDAHIGVLTEAQKSLIKSAIPQ